jgi:hypothetical protein
MTPRRPNLSAALSREAAGREAVYGQPEAVPAPVAGEDRRAGGRPPSPPGTRWEDRHSRHTFHLPTAVVDELKSEAKRLDRSIASVVTEALDQWLTRQRKRRR